MILLALDIGTKKTGVAFGDTTSGFIAALDTIHHSSTKNLIEQVERIAIEKQVEEVWIGLPKLPQGKEGTQAVLTREVGESLKAALKLPLFTIDERFSSFGSQEVDPDAKAACALLEVVLAQKQRT